MITWEGMELWSEANFVCKAFFPTAPCRGEENQKRLTPGLWAGWGLCFPEQSHRDFLSLLWRAEDYKVKGWLAPPETPSEGEGLIPSACRMLAVCGVSWLVDILQGLRLPSTGPV